MLKHQRSQPGRSAELHRCLLVGCVGRDLAIVESAGCLAGWRQLWRSFWSMPPWNAPSSRICRTPYDHVIRPAAAEAFSMKRLSSFYFLSGDALAGVTSPCCALASRWSGILCFSHGKLLKQQLVSSCQPTAFWLGRRRRPPCQIVLCWGLGLLEVSPLGGFLLPRLHR